MILEKVLLFNKGDESQFVVDFQGTPPFSFTYSRTNPGSKNVREEVVTVSDIAGYKVSVFNVVEYFNFSRGYIQSHFYSRSLLFFP
jgi:hypothetical protein